MLKRRADEEFDLDEEEMQAGIVTTADLCLPWLEAPGREDPDGVPSLDLAELAVDSTETAKQRRAFRFYTISSKSNCIFTSFLASQTVFLHHF